jgi:hypothetical protein
MIMIPTSNKEPTAPLTGWIGLHAVVDDRPRTESGDIGGHGSSGPRLAWGMARAQSGEIGAEGPYSVY